MKRRFNSTGRIKIRHDAVAIRVIEDPSGGPSRFTADLSGLAVLGLPPSARVIVEPSVKQSSMRFDFGTLESLQVPADTTLTEVDRGEVAHFRVKVVDTAERPGRLLALAGQLRPRDEREDDDRKPILPVMSEDLGEAVWKLQVGVDEPPILVLNSRMPDLRIHLDEAPLLRGAIFPVAIREVLRVVLLEDVDDELEWVQDWREFAESLLGEALPDDTGDVDVTKSVIERTVEVFCERERWATLTLLQAAVAGVEHE
jgi:hypothetical protein